MTKVEQLTERIKQRTPRARIVLMKDSWWRYVPKFLRPAAFTFGQTIYLRSTEEIDVGLLGHEYQHLVDFQKMGVFGVLSMYLWPQTVGAIWLFLAALAIFFGLTIPAIILAVIGVACLGPWPSKGRAYLEMRGYTVQLYAAMKEGKNIEEYENLVIDSLKSWRYYKMVWSHGEAHRMTSDALDEIYGPGSADTNSVFKDVHRILTDQTIVPPSRPSRPGSPTREPDGHTQ